MIEIVRGDVRGGWGNLTTQPKLTTHKSDLQCHYHSQHGWLIRRYWVCNPPPHLLRHSPTVHWRTINICTIHIHITSLLKNQLKYSLNVFMLVNSISTKKNNTCFSQSSRCRSKSRCIKLGIK